MNSILRFIALAMCVTIALSTATTGTFSSATAYHTASSSAVAYTNGWVVTLTAAGWIYGDAITISSTTPSVTWTTLTQNTGGLLTGVGLVGDSCTTAVTSTSQNTASLVGLAANSCPADFATLYTAAATGTTTTSTISFANAPLTVSQPVKWSLTAPTSTTGKVIGITVTDGSSAAIAVTPAGGATVGSSGGAGQYAVATLNYAFYVETAGTGAVVCFQTDAQHTASTSCGSVVTSSAGILSATITGFVAMIALIFFN